MGKPRESVKEIRAALSKEINKFLAELRNGTKERARELLVDVDPDTTMGLIVWEHRVLVGEDGRVRRVQTKGKSSEIHELLAELVKRLEWEPAIANGRPVTVWTDHTHRVAAVGCMLTELLR